MTEWNRLRELRPEWNPLLAKSTSNTIFLTWEWLESWWTAYGSDRKLFVIAVHGPGDGLIGAAPLCIHSEKRYGRKFRCLRFLGDGTYDSDYLDFVIPAGREAELAPVLLGEMKSAQGKVWDVALLNEIPEQSPNLAHMISWLGAERWLSEQHNVPCAAVALPGSFDQYLGQLKPRFRTAIRAALRNLEDWKGSIEVLADEDHLDAWLAKLFELHARRWQTREQNGVFDSEGKRRFYKELSCALLRAGWLHFTRFQAFGCTLSTQYGFNYGGAYHQLQEGFEVDSAHVAPGVTLRAAMIRDLISQNIRGYDFLGGIGRHKSDWGSSTKNSVRLSCAPPTLAGHHYISFPRTAGKAKQRAKALMKRLPQQSERGPAPSRSLQLQNLNPGRERIASALLQTGGTRAIRAWGARRSRSNCKYAILCYHRIGVGGVPIYTELPTATFAAQMQHLKTHYNVVSLDEAVARVKTGEPGHGVAITFDDGYRGLYSDALPILRRHSLPATIFLTATMVENNDVAWYDRVFLALQISKEEKFDIILDKPRRYLLSDARSRLQAAEAIITILRKLPNHRRQEICAEIEWRTPLPENDLRDRMLTWQQAREMRDYGVTFGAHTLTHPVVSRLSSTELQIELADSKALIESRLNTPVRHFAYPFGRADDIGPDAAACLRELGLESAATTVWGLNGAKTDPWFLRRISIGDEKNLPMFALQIARLFMDEAAADARTADMTRMSEKAHA